MSQHTVFKCNHCKKEIGEKIHISLMIGSNGISSGIAVPPHDNVQWRVRGLPENFLHFHDEKCLGNFFGDLIKTVANSKK